MTIGAGERIRVLQVVPDLGVGGLPRVVETLCRNLDRQRFDVEVLCLRFKGELTERLAQIGIKSHLIERPAGAEGAAYWGPVRIAKHLRRRLPRIVHTHNTEPFVEAGIAAKLTGVPVLIHTDHARDFPDKLRYMFAERLMSHFAHSVVAVSDHGRENLRRYVKVSERKLSTILNGVDAAEVEGRCARTQLIHDWSLPPDAQLIGLGARFTEQKGIEYLIRAMPSVVAEHPRAFAVLVGYGPLEEFLRAEAQASGVADHIRFTGKLPSMAPILGCLDVYALPSIWEGLPMAILEAMAARVPIVASRVGAMAETFVDGRNALLVTPKEPAALATAIGRLLSSADLRRAVAAEARQLFDDRFSAAAMAHAYAGLYERALVEVAPG